MKKVLIYLLIIALGAGAVYFGLTKFNSKDSRPKTSTPSSNKDEEKSTIPTKDDFVIEATKLQTLAEDTNGNITCKCYNAKDLDPNTTLSGSILVYTSGDLFLSNMWLSNGYYILEDSENASTGLLVESTDTASSNCGVAAGTTEYPLCYE